MTSIEPAATGPALPEDRPTPRRNLLDLLSGGLMAVSAMALLAMTIIVSYEVAARYFFHAPTIWAWDINVQLMMLMIMFGLAEVYRRDDYVRVDVLTSLMRPRHKLMLDIILAPIVIVIAAVIVWTSWRYFNQSWARNQHAPTSFAPPLWPIKATIPLGMAVLFLHAVLKMIRDIRLLRNPAPIEPA